MLFTLGFGLVRLAQPIVHASEMIVGVTGIRYGSGCSFLDYDRDGYLDLFVANYVDLDLTKTPRPGHGDFCVWKGIPVMCGPRGLPLGQNVLYHNNRDGTFSDVLNSPEF